MSNQGLSNSYLKDLDNNKEVEKKEDVKKPFKYAKKLGHTLFEFVL
jgi:hypothetical protein